MAWCGARCRCRSAPWSSSSETWRKGAEGAPRVKHRCVPRRSSRGAMPRISQNAAEPLVLRRSRGAGCLLPAAGAWSLMPRRASAGPSACGSCTASRHERNSFPHSASAFLPLSHRNLTSVPSCVTTPRRRVLAGKRQAPAVGATERAPHEAREGSTMDIYHAKQFPSYCRACGEPISRLSKLCDACWCHFEARHLILDRDADRAGEKVIG